MIRPVVAGMLILLVGTIPRNLLFLANLRVLPAVPWAVPAVAVYLWYFWRYLSGGIGAHATAAERRASLRANPVPAPVWRWALGAGGLGLVALVLGLRVANRLVALPPDPLPDVSHVPASTMAVLLLASAPIAGLIEESAFRGYMQGPIERRHGLLIAILMTGTMFALAHLSFTWVLWPYYIAVAALYSTVTALTDSILPAMALHTAGNLYSNFDLWLHGRSDWQAPASQAALVWTTGADAAFWQSLAWFVFATAALIWAMAKLARSAQRHLPSRATSPTP